MRRHGFWTVTACSPLASSSENLTLTVGGHYVMWVRTVASRCYSGAAVMTNLWQHDPDSIIRSKCSLKQHEFIHRVKCSYAPLLLAQLQGDVYRNYQWKKFNNFNCWAWKAVSFVHLFIYLFLKQPIDYNYILSLPLWTILFSQTLLLLLLNLDFLGGKSVMCLLTYW